MALRRGKYVNQPKEECDGAVLSALRSYISNPGRELGHPKLSDVALTQVRPIENQILAVDPRKLDEIPPRIVDMMGYRVHQPFIGYGKLLQSCSYTSLLLPSDVHAADALNPRKAAQRMVEWLRKPVDHSPPTFATTSKL